MAVAVICLSGYHSERSSDGGSADSDWKFTGLTGDRFCFTRIQSQLPSFLLLLGLNNGENKRLVEMQIQGARHC